MSDYLVRHRTRYTYAEPVIGSHNLTCLHPRGFRGQRVDELRLRIEPEPSWRHVWEDAYGNRREAFCMTEVHSTLEVTLLARIQRFEASQPASTLVWEVAPPADDAWTDDHALMREYACPSPQLPMPAEAGFQADDCFSPGRNVVDTLRAFMDRVYGTFKYDPKAPITFTPLNEVYEKRAGGCRDLAHAAIAELRRRGFAAGYVSGYLETQPPAGERKLRGADATHAWYAVYVPGAGWMHYDPTNNVVPGDRHLVCGWGRDYGDVAPLKGVVHGGGAHRVEVEVDVWSWPDQVPQDMRM